MDTFVAEFKPTMGVEFGTQTLELEGQVIKAQIWDIAGEERFRANPSATYRGAVGAIVVFDVGSAVTLESVKSRWLPELKQCGDPSLLPILVANKVDLGEREVSEAQARAVADEFSMGYLEVSALSGQGVLHAFQEVLREVFHYKRLEASLS